MNTSICNGRNRIPDAPIMTGHRAAEVDAASRDPSSGGCFATDNAQIVIRGDNQLLYATTWSTTGTFQEKDQPARRTAATQ